MILHFLIGLRRRGVQREEWFLVGSYSLIKYLRAGTSIKVYSNLVNGFLGINDCPNRNAECHYHGKGDIVVRHVEFSYDHPSPLRSYS